MPRPMIKNVYNSSVSKKKYCLQAILYQNNSDLNHWNWVIYWKSLVKFHEYSSCVLWYILRYAKYWHSPSDILVLIKGTKDQSTRVLSYDTMSLRLRYK